MEAGRQSLPHASIRFEVLEDHLRDHEARSRRVAHRGVGVRHWLLRSWRGSFFSGKCDCRFRAFLRAATATGAVGVRYGVLFLARYVARRPFRGVCAA